MVTATNETSFPVEVTQADQASSVVRRYAYWSGGAGVIPFPLLDLLLISGVQVKMVYELAKVYGIPFSETRAKALIGSLIGTGVPFGVATAAMGGITSALKAIPVVGSFMTLTVGPALGFASTLAVGKVFTKHFAEGGTLSTFVPEAARDLYNKEFKAASKTPAAQATAEVVVEDVKKTK
jgi:uncharacterized protein (DUF697 family)